MKQCAVIGGGLAGLTAAAYLSSRQIPVTLFESSPKIGGRVFSFRHAAFPEPVDNGQHILMGCYRETIKLLNLISPTDRLKVQPALAIEFVLPGQSASWLKASTLVHPLGLLAGLLRYKLLDRQSKMKLLRFMARLYFAKEPLSLEDETISQWLTRFEQTETANRVLWHILAIGTMNAPPELSSARVFESVLRQMLLSDAASARIIIPGADLSQTFCMPAESFIRGHGGIIEVSNKISRVEEVQSGKIIVIDSSGLSQEFDTIVFAAPLHALSKIEGVGELVSLPESGLAFSSIITFHFRLKSNPLHELFYGIVDSPMQWVFNHETHITTVTSAANDLINLSEEELFNLFSSEIEKYFGIQKSAIITHKMIKEKRATFIPSPEAETIRKSIVPKTRNVFLAGDWTNTGLPATIEGAVLSGKRAADAVLTYHA